MIEDRSQTQSLWVARQTLNSAVRAVPCLEGKDHSSFTQQEIKIPCVEERGLRAIISPLTSACCSLLKDVMADQPSKIDTVIVIYCGP